MTDKHLNQFPMPIELPEASAEALQGRQSVRATFKLSAECIDALNIVATHMGIRLKALFDHLAEDRLLLQSIAQQVKTQSWEHLQRAQKTYVISRSTLAVLNRVAKGHKVPRDGLIELSVRRLMPIIAQQQHDYAQRKRILEQLKAHLAGGLQIKALVDRVLGRNDALHEEFTHVMDSYAACVANLERFVEKGKLIETFDLAFTDDREP